MGMLDIPFLFGLIGTGDNHPALNLFELHIIQQEQTVIPGMCNEVICVMNKSPKTFNRRQNRWLTHAADLNRVAFSQGAGIDATIYRCPMYLDCENVRYNHPKRLSIFVGTHLASHNQAY